MAATNPGDVTIQLNGEDTVLRFSLKAARNINAFFGSFAEAYSRVGKLDLGAFTTVIASGADKPVKVIEEAVFKNGMPDLVQPVSDYLNLLANGGKPSDGGDAKDGSEGEG